MKKALRYLLLVIMAMSWSVQSCNQNETPVQQEDHISDVAKFIAYTMSDKYTNSLTGYEQFAHVKTMSEKKFGKTIDVQFDEIERFRKEFVSAYTADDMTRVFNNTKARVGSAVLQTWATQIKNHVLESSTPDDLERRLSRKKFEVTQSSLDDATKEQLYLQIEVTREVAKISDGTYEARIGAASMIRCRGFWRKLCVAATAGITAASVVGSFGTALLAGISVGLIAACCVCGCDCGSNVVCAFNELPEPKFFDFKQLVTPSIKHEMVTLSSVGRSSC